MSGRGDRHGCRRRARVAASLVREVPDWPQPGVTFRDITPLLADPVAFKRCVDELADRFADVEVDAVVGVESRGFILAAPIAYRLGAVVRARCARPASCRGPSCARSTTWSTARDKLEIHRDAIHPDDAGAGHRRRAGHRRHRGRHRAARRGARRRRSSGSGCSSRSPGSGGGPRSPIAASRSWRRY